MSTALSHVRVLDLSRILAGPWASHMRADLGADVVKVERFGLGDDTRSWGPPYLKDRAGHDTADSAYEARRVVGERVMSAPSVNGKSASPIRCAGRGNRGTAR